MKVLVVGSGGREHALCEKIAQSSLVTELFVAPGNSGIKKSLPQIQMVSLKATDIEGLLILALKEKMDLTVVGPEVSLEAGIVDLFEKNGLKIFGPSKTSAQLETSKVFAKEIMLAANVPTAQYKSFLTFATAVEFIERTTWTKMVVKCDSLAAGKGVVVCESKSEAFVAVKNFMIDQILGFKVTSLLIEEYLTGPEVSVFALADGNDVCFIGTAQDHKRLRDFDEGPNTGGMGVISPSPVFSKQDEVLVLNTIFKPVMTEMKNRGIPFKGVLFVGLMKTEAGYKTLEFNVRFGDPETQALMSLIEDDILLWFKACAEEKLSQLTSPRLSTKKAIHIVMAAHGYPGTEGREIRCGDEILIHSIEHKIFFAGVTQINEKLVTSGGRVLGITALGETVNQAQIFAYSDIQKISFAGAQFRKDIGGLRG